MLKYLKAALDLIIELDLLRRISRVSFGIPKMYESLRYESELELVDGKGAKAVFRKFQKVRFCQDNIIAYHDLAWGDGNIFADYQCSPGKAVDHYREGNIYHILISLRETKNRGDVEEFYIKRTIRNGFRRKREYYQNRVNHPMRYFSTAVIFPVERPPRQVAIIERNRNRTIELGPEHIQLLPDGRQKVIWETSHPRLYETYSIRWDW